MLLLVINVKIKNVLLVNDKLEVEMNSATIYLLLVQNVDFVLKCKIYTR